MGNNPSEMLPEEHSRQKDIQRVDSELSQNLSKGTHWNMKVIIRGEKNTGKTSLFRRLQGQPFVSEYTPSDSLKSANISWNYRTTHDVIKVEIWDVVDSLKSNRASDGKLKFTDSKAQSHISDEPLYEEVDLDTVPVAGKTLSPSGNSTIVNLDASMIDVLRGTHAIILLFNPYKKWTWDYVKKELERIPKRIHVLVMNNFKDLENNKNDQTASNSIQVSSDEVKNYLDLLDRRVYYLESSMVNCYGLKGLKTFLNVPFLHLQREFFEAQLKQNSEDLKNAQEEFDLITENDTYDRFLQMLAHRQTNLNSSSNTISNNNNNKDNNNHNIQVDMNNNLTPNKDNKPKSSNAAQVSNQSSTKPNSSTSGSISQDKPKAQSPPSSSPSSPAPKTSSDSNESGGFFSKLFSKKDDKQIKPKEEDKKAVEELKKLKEMGIPANSDLGSVEDFVPDSNDDWLSDLPASTPSVIPDALPNKKVEAPKPSKPIAKPSSTIQNDDDDDDDDAPNPAIADYTDELDDSDQLLMQALAKARAEKAEKEAKAKLAEKQAKELAAKMSQIEKDDDSDDEDDDTNPALAEYEDDLDMEDKMIKGKPAPQVAKQPSIQTQPQASSATTLKKTAVINDNDDDDDDDANPALAGYEEDLDVNDFSPISSPAPRRDQSQSSSSSPSGFSLRNREIPPVSSQKSPSSNSNAVVAQPSKPNVSVSSSTKAPQKIVNFNSDDEDSDNDLVAKDEDGSDDDDDFAGFVPKKPGVQTTTQDLSSIPDFNPLDAVDDDDANAFWAASRQVHRKPAAPQQQSTTQNSADPFSFHTSGSSVSDDHHSMKNNEKDKKDKRHKHKDKKDKDKDKHKSSKHNSHSNSPLPATDFNFGHAAPPANLHTPPPAAPKKNVFYL